MRDKWVIWCNLNIEQDKLEQLFGNDCVSIKGATALYKKVELEKFGIKANNLNSKEKK